MPHNEVALQNLKSPFENFCKNHPGKCSLNLQNLECHRGKCALQNLDGLQNLARVKDGRVQTNQGAKIKFISDAIG